MTYDIAFDIPPKLDQVQKCNHVHREILFVHRSNKINIRHNLFSF